MRGDEQTGKTTLLRLLAGEVLPDAGQIETLGQSPTHSLALYQRLVFRCDPFSDALDQTSASAWFEGLPTRFSDFNKTVLGDLIAGFALTPHLHKPLYMLSAGSRRKAWLCAAFASGAPVILIDQPFAALDGPSMRLLREVLQEMGEHPSRACVLADYEAPADVPLACVIDL
ncbi:ATP-binding cassette domain-containing protein [Hydrogenophaga sp. PAMC20947]|nr:ATP-binding cassette domain-containing protein [Hydrogenophaga sp. PAMC20947]